MGWKNFNDRLALLILVAIGAIWIMMGLGLLVFEGEIIGVQISVFTLIVQYYFRRKPEEPPTKPTDGEA